MFFLLGVFCVLSAHGAEQGLLTNAVKKGYITPQSFPKTFSDVSFSDRIAVKAEGYEAVESVYDSNGVCISGCAYAGITLVEEERLMADAEEELYEVLMLEGEIKEDEEDQDIYDASDDDDKEDEEDQDIYDASDDDDEVDSDSDKSSTSGGSSSSSSSSSNKSSTSGGSSLSSGSSSGGSSTSGGSSSSSGSSSGGSSSSSSSSSSNKSSTSGGSSSSNKSSTSGGSSSSSGSSSGGSSSSSSSSSSNKSSTSGGSSSSNKSSTSGGSSSSSGSSSGGSSSSSSSSSSNKSSSSGGSSSSNKSSGTDVVPKKNKNGSQNYFRPPVNGDIVKIGSDFGQRAAPKTKNGKTGTAYHRGVDIKARNNTKLYAAADGIVIQASWWRGYGNVVKIQHSFTVSKKTAVTLYAHMNSFSVKKGQKVKKGQLIGYSGNTGNSGGPHLHYELRFNNIKVDPLGSKVKPVLENKKQVNAAAVTAGINYIGKKFCFKKGISSARLKKYRGNNAALKKQFPQCLGWCNSY